MPGRRRIGACALFAALLLCRCSAAAPGPPPDAASFWSWPWQMLWPRREARAEARQSIIITAKVGEDPRPQADDFCAKQSRYPRLTAAERTTAADPADEAITWHFDCVY